MGGERKSEEEIGNKRGREGSEREGKRREGGRENKNGNRYMNLREPCPLCSILDLVSYGQEEGIVSSTWGCESGMFIQMDNGLFLLDIFLCIISSYNFPRARVTEVGLF